MAENRIKVVDNFLTEKEFKELTDLVLDNNFAWFYQKDVSGEKEEKSRYEDGKVAPDVCFFTHLFYRYYTPLSGHYEKLKPILEKINPLAIIRIKGNCYPATQKIIVHEKHADYPYQHKGLLFSLNDCDGYTLIGDEKVQSKANRALFFDPTVLHSSTTCTNKRARFNINFNYFSE